MPFESALNDAGSSQRSVCQNPERIAQTMRTKADGKKDFLGTSRFHFLNSQSPSAHCQCNPSHPSLFTAVTDVMSRPVHCLGALAVRSAEKQTSLQLPRYGSVVRRQARENERCLTRTTLHADFVIKRNDDVMANIRIRSGTLQSRIALSMQNASLNDWTTVSRSL